MKPGSSLSNILLGLLIAYRVLVSFIPALGYYSPTSINIASVLLLYVLVFSMMGIQKSLRTLGRYLPLFFMLIVDLLFGYQGKMSSLAVFVYLIMQALLWPLLVEGLKAGDYRKLARNILVLIVISYIITSVTTIVGNIAYPGASRALARLAAQDDAETAYMYQSFNIGGVEFVYQLVLLVPLLIYVIRCSKFWGKLLAVAILVIFAAVIYISEYTTALIFALLAFILFLIPKGFSSKQLLRMGIVVALIAFVLVYVIDIFSIVSNLVEGSGVAERLQDVSNMVHGKKIDSSGDLDARGSLWSESVNNFLSSPIWGTGKSGGHSYLLDHLGMFGLIGALLQYVLFKKMNVLAIRPYKGSPFYITLLVVFLMELGLTMFNAYTHIVIFTVVIPLFCYVFSPKNTINDNV